jgi:glycosyltransferase involved in cell wall biosynthesis
MKILQICPPWIATPPKGYGGTEWVIYNLSEGLIALGHQVTMFATGDSKTSGELKYVLEHGVIDMGMPWEGALLPMLHYNEAFKLAREGDFDLVHVHLSAGADMLLFPFVADLKIPHVMTIHGHWPYDKFTNSDEYFLKLYGSKANAISISKIMEGTLPKEINALGSVYNGINLDTLHFHGKPKGDYVTWLGKIIPDKGLHEGILAAKKAGVQMIFAGKIDDGQPKSVAYFNDVVKPLIDGEQIQFLGEADLKMKNDIVGNAKGFMNPINWVEPFGLVMAESLSLGTPVISYARGAANEIIQHGKTGFLVKNVDNEEARIAEMAEYVKELDKIDRVECRKSIEERFSLAAMTQDYLTMYDKVIKKSDMQIQRMSTKRSSVFRMLEH